MNVGTLEIQMLANMARLAQDMESAKRTVGNAMGNIEKVVGQAKTALGALGIGLSVDYFVDFIKGGVDAMDNLNDLTKSTSLTVETLSGLQLLAKQSGGDLGGMADAINKLSVNMGKDAEKFARLGVTARDPLEAFKQLANVYAAIEDPQLRASMAAEALGKRWASAAPALAEGGQRIGEMVERGQRLSGVTKENAERADQFNDQLAELNTLMGAAKTRMVGDMLPALIDTTRAITLAYEESGKLRAIWVALGALGAFAFTNEFASAAVKIQDLKSKLEELEHERDMAEKMPAVGIVSRWLFGTGKNDGEIDRVRSEIAALQAEMDRPAKKATADKQAAADAAAKAKAFAESEELARKAKEASDKAKQQEKELRKEGLDGWVKYADAVLEEGERIEAMERQQIEGRNREEDHARAEDLKGWVAYAEARVNEDFEMAQQLAKQQIEAAEEVKRQQHEVWQSVERTAHDTFIGIWKGGRDVFTRLTEMIENTLLEVLYQMTIKKWIVQIEQQVTSTGGVSGGGGGIWEALGSKFGNMFSGNGGFGTGSSYGNQDYGAYFANGGDHSGGWRVVGERGPELEATGPSRIFNAQQTRDILGGGSGGDVQISMPVTVSIQGNADDGVIRRALQEMEGRIYKNVPSVIRAAQLRNRTTPTV